MSGAAEMIYHIASEAEWVKAAGAGVYRADSLNTEGFIHCSTAAQVAGTANLLFFGRKDLVLLEIDPALVVPEIKYESAPGGQMFPHIYGPLDVRAVTRALAFQPGKDGKFRWPQDD